MLDNPVQEPKASRGYLKLFLDEVNQADQGVDFNFLSSPITVLVPQKKDR